MTSNRALKTLLGSIALIGSINAYSNCQTTFAITLNTFGEGVQVELRGGSPGSSRAIATRYSNGGRVYFENLCPGNYFLAIGDKETVSTTPVRYFEDFSEYSSSIVLQRGAGNVSKRSRSSL